ncbi:MAG: Ig-like domain-containing protein, partial [Planctomycetota bacterium]|nr:Ig-like domain-containing protein [Planctomycetota bacterium]
MVCVLVAATMSGCDNIARIFDNKGGSSSGGPTTNVQTIRTGGVIADGRPVVKSVYPSGGSGFPESVPVVVVFSESMHEDSLSSPGPNAEPMLYVRNKTTKARIPSTYNFLLGGTVVVIRPPMGLPNTQGTSYEVVVGSEARDVDGLRVGGATTRVLSEFKTDQDREDHDGRVLVTLPEDNKKDRQRETPVYVIFDKPAKTTSVSSSNLKLTDGQGSPISGNVSFPLQGNDGRVARIDPDALLGSAADVEIVVDDTITFDPDGKLDFGKKTPLARFTTVAMAAPLSVGVGKGTPFPDKVNRNNLSLLLVDVEVDASVQPNDRISMRIYGLDPKTANATDVNFIEAAKSILAAGRQTVTVEFRASLGTLDAPRFSEGALTFAAMISRGSRETGYVLSDAGNSPRFDITPPSIAKIGAPGAGNDLFTDQEYVALMGKASERLGEATIKAGGAPQKHMYACSGDGTFIMEALTLPLLTSGRAYTLTVTDLAGNIALGALSGKIHQRGVVTGSV